MNGLLCWMLQRSEIRQSSELVRCDAIIKVDNTVMLNYGELIMHLPLTLTPHPGVHENLLWCGPSSSLHWTAFSALLVITRKGGQTCLRPFTTSLA